MTTAKERFSALDGKRRTMLKRHERYAAWTLPKVCLPDSNNENYDDVSHDYQSVGAQSVNHLTNKLMLALFAPSRPCMRLDATPKTKDALAAAANGDPAVIASVAQQVTAAEKEATNLLDRRKLRPKLYEVIKNLIITGNVLLILDKETIRAKGIKQYVVRRKSDGSVREIVTREPMAFDELEQDVQDYLNARQRRQPNQAVELFCWLTLAPTGDMVMDQWVGSVKLPEEFSGKWAKGNCPYRPLTWDLASGHHYGTGLVEDYANDFAGLSQMSKAQAENAILSSEFRWLANPAGTTSIPEFVNSRNGDVLAGNKDDLYLVESSKRGDLQTIGAIASEYVNRIGRGFLLSSMLVRQAERVTAEEIRQTAQELETALGGAYSRIAGDFQGPLAGWLLAGVNPAILEDFTVTIITGMDALSRSGDLEDLKLWLADLAAVSQLPEPIQQILNMRVIVEALALPRRIDATLYLKSEAQIAQEQQAAMQAQQQAMAEQSLVTASAQQVAKGPPKE
jgi:hypothetical protein